MKVILTSALCLVVFSVSIVAAVPRSGYRPEGICTRDINVWGQAGHCSCEEGLSYDERSGLCLEDGDADVMIKQGALSAGVMAIGGETTGFVIVTKANESYELILKTADQEKLLKLDGMWLEVEGPLVMIESVERATRTAIIAERVAVLE